MLKSFVVATVLAAMCAGCTVAYAQGSHSLPPVQGSPSGMIPPCPTIAEQEAAAGKKTKEGTAVAPVQPVEGSVILPSAGGDSRSGSPSAQQDGRSLRAGIDCPMAPNHPNAVRPDTSNK